ncbi:MAG: hypothetical protein O3A51_02300 [Verrucomicrobia bacterium]|nr:hypothetical protein [Verrucomicrobiota bacterium]
MIRNFLLASLIMLGLTSVLVAILPGPYVITDIAAALLLATLNGLAASMINYISLGRQTGTSMKHSALGHGVRAAAMLIALCLAPSLGIQNFALFFIITMNGYFCFLGAEIITLHKQVYAS